ncbi:MULTISPECIES: hypothetical protein [unclassified Microcoleus]|uniref:hypothetical protein n=1 Tax=unclassified Microcoleus TaxID=2642155 RepID=UPI002FCEE7E2
MTDSITDYNAAYHEIINRIDAIEKRLPVRRKRYHKNPTVAFNCPTEAYNQLCVEAGGLALTRSELLRMIVLDYLSNKGKPQGFAKRIIDDDDLIDF